MRYIDADAFIKIQKDMCEKYCTDTENYCEHCCIKRDVLDDLDDFADGNNSFVDWESAVLQIAPEYAKFFGNCCGRCKFLYPLHRFVWNDEKKIGEIEYGHVCLLFPKTEDGEDAFAMEIDNPDMRMCEMFSPREEAEHEKVD